MVFYHSVLDKFRSFTVFFDSKTEGVLAKKENTFLIR
jgi:hypothetical protein